MKLNVIYEDNHIIVVEKPAGIPTQGDSSGDIDMYTLVGNYIREKYNKPGNVFVGIVHRLDRPVGGIMVFARTSKGASRLSEEIRNRSFKKTYMAMVNGCPREKKGTLRDYLLKDERKNKSFLVDDKTSGAKLAILEYEVLSHNEENNTSIVKVDLHTGRHHQIRFQFANIGCPLVGDSKYGKEKGTSNVKLWAYKLEFKHPTRDEVMKFELQPKW